MFTLAFYAFLRIGEITLYRQKDDSKSVLQTSQITTKCANGLVQSLLVIFNDYKHHYNKNEFTLVLNRQPKACPVEYYLEFIKLRGNTKGPLFQNQNGTTVSRREFT